MPTGDSEAAKVGALPLPDIDVKLLFRAVPTEPPPLVAVDEVIGRTQPVAAAAAADKARADVAKTQALLAQVSPDDFLYARLESALKESEAKLAQLTKHAPGQAVYIEQLTTTRQRQVEERARWEARVAAGAKKSADRLAEQSAAIDALTDQLLDRKAKIKAAHAANAAEWATYNQHRRDQYQGVIDQLEAKITAAKALTVAPPAADAGAAAAEVVTEATPPGPPAATAETAEEALTRVTASFNAQLAAAQAEVERLRALAPTVAPAAPGPVPAHLRTFECIQEDLPDEALVPTAEQWPQVVALHAALELLERHETTTGYVYPATYDELKTGLDVPRALLGDTIWGLAYPSSATGTSVVTRQVRQLLLFAFQKHHDRLLHEKAKHDAAAQRARKTLTEAFAEAAAKRRRTAPDAATAAAMPY